MKRVFAQVQKELTQFKRDKLTVALAFVLPLMTFLLFGYGARLEMKDIPIVVQDLDNSPLSRSLAERMFSTQQLNPVSSSDVIKSIDKGQASAAVIIPPDLSRQFKAGTDPKIQVLIDGTDVNNARVIKNSLLAIKDFLLSTMPGAPDHQIVQPQIRLWFNPGRKESLYMVPGTLALILWIYPSLLSSLALVREKEQGTILQAYASSISAAELLAGKAIAYLLIGIAEALLIMFLSFVLFGLNFAGDPFLFFVGTILYILDSVLFGMLIGSRASTQSAAVQGVATVGFTSAMLLSGFLYPLRNIKFPFNYFTYIVPARYYVILSRDTFVRGSSWDGCWYIPICLLVFALFYFNVSKKIWSRMQIKS